MFSPKYSHHPIPLSPRNCSKGDDPKVLKKRIERLKKTLKQERQDKKNLIECLNFIKEKCSFYETEFMKEKERIHSLEK